MITRLPVTIYGHTLLGGTDNPNCFTLQGSVRIINMKMGPFERVVKQLAATDVEVRLLSSHIGVIVDPRFPENELTNSRWCTVCCPTSLLPEEQLRNYLKYWRPSFLNGVIVSWSGSTNDGVPDDEVEANMKRLKEYHGKAS